jgi:hypothetical protein
VNPFALKILPSAHRASTTAHPAMISAILIAALAFIEEFATAQNACPAPSNTTYTETPSFSVDELWDLHQQFTTAYIYPNNAIQAESINSTLLADNIMGRVDITRDFNGRVSCRENEFMLEARANQRHSKNLSPRSEENIPGESSFQWDFGRGYR